MTEVSFAKSFLSALDSRPPKLSADHVEDPRSYPRQTAYILPRMPKPMSKRVKLTPGQERSVTVHIKSLRNPPLDIKLTSQPLHTSVLDVKTAVSEQANIPLDKIKVLYKKKPTQDSKVLKDLVEEGETAVEFSVMIMGGAAAIKADEVEAKSSPAQGLSGEAVLQTDEFWTDLKGFLLQRVRDEKLTEELVGRFLSSWESR